MSNDIVELYKRGQKLDDIGLSEKGRIYREFAYAKLANENSGCM